MALKICAVRDAAINAFGQPIFVRHVGEAIRSFTDEVNRDGSAIQAHPEDYELFHIGEYDDLTALVIPADRPISLVTGKSCVKSQELISAQQ